jgi:hypothetical protein
MQRQNSGCGSESNGGCRFPKEPHWQLGSRLPVPVRAYTPRRSALEPGRTRACRTSPRLRGIASAPAGQRATVTVPAAVATAAGHCPWHHHGIVARCVPLWARAGPIFRKPSRPPPPPPHTHTHTHTHRDTQTHTHTGTHTHTHTHTHARKAIAYFMRVCLRSVFSTVAAVTRPLLRWPGRAGPRARLELESRPHLYVSTASTEIAGPPRDRCGLRLAAPVGSPC